MSTYTLKNWLAGKERGQHTQKSQKFRLAPMLSSLSQLLAFYVRCVSQKLLGLAERMDWTTVLIVPSNFRLDESYGLTDDPGD